MFYHIWLETGQTWNCSKGHWVDMKLKILVILYFPSSDYLVITPSRYETRIPPKVFIYFWWHSGRLERYEWKSQLFTAWLLTTAVYWKSSVWLQRFYLQHWECLATWIQALQMNTGVPMQVRYVVISLLLQLRITWRARACRSILSNWFSTKRRAHIDSQPHFYLFLLLFMKG